MGAIPCGCNSKSTIFLVSWSIFISFFYGISISIEVILLFDIRVIQNLKSQIIWCKFSIIIEMYARTALSNCAIWDKFSSKTSKNLHILCPIRTYLVQIRCRFNAHFVWVQLQS